MVKTSQKLISTLAFKDIRKDESTKVLEYYAHYRKAADILERTYIALGRKKIFRTSIRSTLNFEVDCDGIFSTTAHRIKTLPISDGASTLKLDGSF